MPNPFSAFDARSALFGEVLVLESGNHDFSLRPGHMVQSILPCKDPRLHVGSVKTRDRGRKSLI